MKRTVDLKNLTFFEIKQEWMEQAKEEHYRKYGFRLTQEMIHNKTGIPVSTLSRIFTDPHYNPYPEKLALLCNAMENWLPLKWLAAQCGGTFARMDQTATKADSVPDAVKRVQMAATDLAAAMIDALKDNTLTAEELRKLSTIFRVVIEASESGVLTAEWMDRIKGTVH